MPKKFKGENSKAAEARARKEQKRVDEQESKQKALEDEYWKDDDKHALRKQQRKVKIICNSYYYILFVLNVTIITKKFR